MPSIYGVIVVVDVVAWCVMFVLALVFAVVGVAYLIVLFRVFLCLVVGLRWWLVCCLGLLLDCLGCRFDCLFLGVVTWV